jgi:hypothetical protein
MKRNTLFAVIGLVVLLILILIFTFSHHGERHDGGGHHNHDITDSDDIHGVGHMYEEFAEHNVKAFQTTLEAKVVADVGQPIEGFMPGILLQEFSGLRESDFDEVDVMIGHFEYANGDLIHDLEGAEMIHSAADALTNEGYETLLENVAERLGVMMHDGLDEVIEKIAGEGSVDENIVEDDGVIEDASPISSSEVICTDEMKQTQACTREYAPVCGLVQVQCITTPCDPVPETFSNGCGACSQGNVVSYTAGECTI